MEYKYEEGDIVIYKKDNSIYKIEKIELTTHIVTGIRLESYTIANDQKKVHSVLPKDIELL